MEDIGEVRERTDGGDLAINLAVALIEDRRQTLTEQLANLDDVLEFVLPEATTSHSMARIGKLDGR